MLEQTLFSRRAVAKALPLVAVSAGSISAAAYVSSASADERQIDVAAERYRASKSAFAAAIAAYELALPPLHPSINLTGCSSDPFMSEAERGFAGEHVKRTIDRRGEPMSRQVATLDTIRLDLNRHGSRGMRRHLYRMRRRIKVRQAKIEALEKSFDLWRLRRDAMTAERDFSDLAARLFEKPATDMASVLTQAKALSAVAAIDEGYIRYQTGRFGLILAVGLQQVAKAA